MPASTQLLYFHLGMVADDDGFVNPKRVMRMIGVNEDDLKILIAKRFVITFENGVVVIKHWAINNLIRKDWYRPTVYSEEKKRLQTKENGAYTELVNELVNGSATEIRIDQDSLDQDSTSVSTAVAAIPPKDEAEDFFRNPVPIINELIDNGLSPDVVKREIKAFINYWTELNGTGKKQRWQMEKVFQVKRRLATWFGRSSQFKNSKERTRKIWT
jgi:hypothetical protein